MDPDQKMSIMAHSTGNTAILYGLIKDKEYYESQLNLMIGLGAFT